MVKKSIIGQPKKKPIHVSDDIHRNLKIMSASTGTNMNKIVEKALKKEILRFFGGSTVKRCPECACEEIDILTVDGQDMNVCACCSYAFEIK